MKKNLLLVLFIMAVCSANAQFRFGVTAGGNVSKITMEDGLGNNNGLYKSRIGFQGGAVAEYMFSDVFGLQTRLLYTQNGSNMDKERLSEGMRMTNEEEIPEGMTMGGRTIYNQIQLPLYAKVKYPIAPGLDIYGLFGGFAGYIFDGKAKMEAKLNGVTQSFTWDLFDVQIFDGQSTEINPYYTKRWNAGLAVELGFELSDKMFLGVGYKRILTEMSAYSIAGYRLKTHLDDFSLSAGYFF
ncbi:porin family protein [Dysgonomonas gadei]|uniref:Outer membrane protein beta-barrel domain-containing protein n=1 Tax=Dysgonomonas gadei ATCC BAA-286 TaxID=742766 RepID=F5J0Q7_9BACT|nr:porin family protein [Dysgonomonas gadei]EGK00650.1 hypothetical protein HMPREF9455_02924 [Dysgonomonas gadei ATCC BAA-286]